MTHPLFVHFPIAFYFLELLLLVFWRIKREAHYEAFASFAFRIGYLFMVAALVTGLFDAGGPGNIRNLSGNLAIHFYSAVCVFVFYSARAFLLRRFERASAVFRIGSAIFGNGLVTAAAYLGGRLVYR